MPVGPVSPSSPASGAADTIGASAGPLANDRLAGNATLEKVAAGTATLKQGARGDAVRKVQAALYDMGFSIVSYPGSSGRQVGGIDGEFGGQTATALANFQRHAAPLYAGVRDTGELDQATLLALDALAPPAGRKAWAPGLSPRAPSPFWNGDAGLPLRVAVVKNEHRTFLFGDQGDIKAIYPNATGTQTNPTKTGLKRVTAKLDERAARDTGRRLWKDEKAFGTRILDLSWSDGRSSGEELHGTYNPRTLGTDPSHGCVRHENAAIEAMFGAVNVGDLVAIVGAMDDPSIA